MSVLEQIRVSKTLGRQIEAVAERTGRTMRDVLDGAIRSVLDREDASVDLTPKRANLSVYCEGKVAIAIYNGRFAGVGIDILPSKPDERTFLARSFNHGRFCPGGPLLLDWCDWFREMCRGAGVELR